VREHFEIRFATQPKLGLNLDGVQFTCLSNEDNEMLCCKFSDNEIFEAVTHCESSKSPGPDGFNFHFIKKNWEIIGTDMIMVVHSFYEGGLFREGVTLHLLPLYLRGRIHLL